MKLEKLMVVNIIYGVSLSYLLYFCSAKDIPAFYIFGDSLVDVGNNFYLKNSLARAEYPNGIDFGNAIGISSGRYTNGRTAIDIIEQESGLKNFTPPYLSPTTKRDVILKGVNYASSASGILNETRPEIGDCIPLDVQISYFEKTRQNIIAQIGAPAAKKLLNNAICIVVTGASDVKHAAKRTNLETPLSFYFDNIISRFRSQLTRLYELDVRKIMVTNSGAAGCIPFERDDYPFIRDGCVPFINHLGQGYNRRLKRLLGELNANLAGSKFVLADAYAMLEDIIRNYISYGFEVVDEACCHFFGLHGGSLPCCLSLVCPDRTKYVFWDAWHLTETANIIVEKHMMDGGPNYMSPMNFRQLLNS